MTSIDNLAEEIMQGLQEYADLADTAMKKAVRKTATQVKNEISANAPKDTGKYAKSWATKKTGENSHSLEMTVHMLRISYQLAHLIGERAMPSVAVVGCPANRILLLRKKTVYSCWSI